MKLSSHLITATLLILLYGCAPMAVEYYAPSASNGVLVGPSGCGRLLGPRTGIEFNNYGLVVLVVARNGNIHITITVPDGKSAAFLSDELELSSNITSKYIKLKLSALNYNHYRNIGTKPEYEQIAIKPTEAMIGKTYKLSSFLKQPRIHGVSVSVQGPLPEQFYVKLPSIMFGTTEIKYPVIDFTKTKGVGVYSVNC